ncbi:MAG: hypothetical protein GX444_10070 [Myxococcales bacterium]|nr:hypothetical protein [Myxococcales bacterium]
MQVMKRYFIFLLTIVLCVQAADAWAAKKKKTDAAEPTATAPDLDDRTLKGHMFFRSLNFPLAIPTTNVGVNLGYAYVTTKFKDVQDFLVVQEDTFHAGGLAEVMDLEFAFFNRFSFEAQLIGRALAGADETTAVVYGGQGQYSAFFTPKVSLVQSESWGTCVALASDVIYDQGVQSSPAILMVQMLNNMLEMLEKIEKTQQLPDEDDIRDLSKINLKDATVTQDTLSIRPSLLIAQTLHPTFGLQAGLRYDYGIQEHISAPDEFEMDAGDPPTSIMAGVTGTFDFNPISRLHMGLKAEFDYSQTKDDDTTYDDMTLGGGILYTGRRNLDLGATFLREETKSEDVTEEYLILYLNMRYIF